MNHSKIFLDSNFLIANQVKGHKFYERTRELRTIWEVNNTELYISPLVLDEVLYVCKGILENTKKEKEEIYKTLKKALENIFNYKNLTLLQTQLQKKDWMEILKFMEKENKKPRDSIILQIMKKEKINAVSTFDSDFEGLKNIEVVK